MRLLGWVNPQQITQYLSDSGRAVFTPHLMLKSHDQITNWLYTQGAHKLAQLPGDMCATRNCFNSTHGHHIRCNSHLTLRIALGEW